MNPKMPRLLALGDSAWTLEFGSTIDPAINSRVMGLMQRVQRLRGSDARLASITDLVPTFRSLTVHFDPWNTDAEGLGQALLSLVQESGQVEVQGRRWQLPVCFDEDFAPDLARVCELKQLARAAVIDHFLTATFRVYMIGFQPGFPYMGGLPSELQVPRLPSPRQKVPAQSVAVALDMCAVYPWDSPGGWNLLGRTPMVLFDPSRAAQPAMLSAGDELQWTPIDRSTYDELAAEIARGLPRETFLKAPVT